MKKLISILAVLVLILTAVPVFSAESVSVSFESGRVNAYCGMTCWLTVGLSEPVGSDAAFTLSGDNGSSVSVTIPAGELTGSTEIEVSPESGAEVEYVLSGAAGYAIGKNASCRVFSYPIPSFSFYSNDIAVAKDGESFTGTVVCSKTNSAHSPITLSLREGSEKGEKLGEVVMPAYASKGEFTVTVSAADGYLHELYLCNDRLGVSLDTLRIAVSTDAMRNITGAEPCEANANRIAVSFDCGNSSTKFTRYILDTLDEYNAKATFFITGEWLRVNPDMVLEIYQRGHDIGNHTVHHPRLTNMSLNEVYDELSEMSDRLEAVTGERPTLFRPPYGAANKSVIAVAKSCGMDSIRWTVDSYDWKKPTSITAKTIIKRCTENAKAGDIILFHNAGYQTESTLVPILDYYTKDLGLEVVRISDLIYKGNFTVDENGRQTVGSDYAWYTADELLPDFDASVLYDEPGTDADVVFDGDAKVFLYSGDAEKIRSISGDGASLLSGKAPIDASFSADDPDMISFGKNGNVWFTARIVPPEDEDPAAVSDADTESADPSADPSPAENFFGCGSFTPAETALVIASAALAVAVICLFLLRRKK